MTSNPTTEPRQGPAQTIVVTFDKPASAATVVITGGSATAGASTFSGANVIIGLTGVTNENYVTVSPTNVVSTDRGSGGSGSARLGFPLGDVSGGRVVRVRPFPAAGHRQLLGISPGHARAVGRPPGLPADGLWPRQPLPSRVIFSQRTRAR